MSKKIIIIGSLGAAVVAVPAVVVAAVFLINKNDDRRAENGQGGYTPTTVIGDPINVTVPNEFMPGIMQDAQTYDDLKNEQGNFGGANSKNGILDKGYLIYENDWIKFSFDPGAVSSLNGKVNVEKFIQKGISMLIFTSANLLMKTTVNITGNSDPSANGNAAPGGGDVTVFLGSILKTPNLTTEELIFLGTSVLVHEFGHSTSESLLPNNGQSLNMVDRWNNFLNDSPYENLSKNNTIQEIKTKHPSSYIPVFSHPEKWAQERATTYWGGIGTNPYVPIDNETFTRIQLAYTTKLNGGILSSIINKNGFPLKNQIEVTNWLGYNLFDENDPLQAFKIMKPVVKYYYGIGNKPIIDISGSGQLLEFQSDGIEGNESIENVVIFDDQNTEIYRFKPEHQDIPLGFNKNPFLPEYSYKYVMHSTYFKDDKIVKNSLASATKAKFYDSSNNEISTTPIAIYK